MLTRPCQEQNCCACVIQCWWQNHGKNVLIVKSYIKCIGDVDVARQVIHWCLRKCYDYSSFNANDKEVWKYLEYEKTSSYEDYLLRTTAFRWKTHRFWSCKDFLLSNRMTIVSENYSLRKTHMAWKQTNNLNQSAVINIWAFTKQSKVLITGHRYKTKLFMVNHFFMCVVNYTFDEKLCSS